MRLLERVLGLLSPYHNVEAKAQFLRDRALAHDVRVVKRTYLQESRAACSLFLIHPSNFRRNLADEAAVAELNQKAGQELPSLSCKVIEQTLPELVTANPEEVRKAHDMGVSASFVRRYVLTPVTRKWIRVDVAVKTNHAN